MAVRRKGLGLGLRLGLGCNNTPIELIVCATRLLNLRDVPVFFNSSLEETNKQLTQGRGRQTEEQINDQVVQEFLGNHATLLKLIN